MIRSVATIPAVVLLGLSALLMSAPASADDYKFFSAMNCVPNGPPSAQDTDLSYSYLGLLNTSETENLIVTCPINKDSIGTGSDPFGTIRYSYKTANNTTGVVNCTVQVGFLTSTFYSASTAEPIRPSNYVGNPELTMLNGSNVYAPVNLVCSLSPRARLLRIWTVEAVDTDAAY